MTDGDNSMMMMVVVVGSCCLFCIVIAAVVGWLWYDCKLEDLGLECSKPDVTCPTNSTRSKDKKSCTVDNGYTCTHENGDPTYVAGDTFKKPEGITCEWVDTAGTYEPPEEQPPPVTCGETTCTTGQVCSTDGTNTCVASPSTDNPAPGPNPPPAPGPNPPGPNPPPSNPDPNKVQVKPKERRCDNYMIFDSINIKSFDVFYVVGMENVEQCCGTLEFFREGSGDQALKTKFSDVDMFSYDKVNKICYYKNSNAQATDEYGYGWTGDTKFTSGILMGVKKDNNKLTPIRIKDDYFGVVNDDKTPLFAKIGAITRRKCISSGGACSLDKSPVKDEPKVDEQSVNAATWDSDACSIVSKKYGKSECLLFHGPESFKNHFETAYKKVGSFYSTK